MVIVLIIELLVRNGGICVSSLWWLYSILILLGFSILCLENVVKLMLSLCRLIGWCGIDW